MYSFYNSTKKKYRKMSSGVSYDRMIKKTEGEQVGVCS